MKKILSLILCLAVAVGTLTAFASCSDDEDVLVCGVTPIPGLNEKDANGEWTIGFETEFAIEVGKIIGMDVEFKEINWGQKYTELKAGSIDCIWNGFTANSSEEDGTKRSDLVDFSYGYMLNQQCVVVKKDNLDKIKTEEDLGGLKACVESGSAGETYAKTVTDGQIKTATAQIKAFPEVKSGSVDFAVVDIILAQNMCGKGDYSDLAIVESIELASEIYAVGFEKGSALTAKVNEAIKELEENGKLMELAEKYGFENVIKVTEEIK